MIERIGECLVRVAAILGGSLWQVLVIHHIGKAIVTGVTGAVA